MDKRAIAKNDIIEDAKHIIELEALSRARVEIERQKIFNRQDILRAELDALDAEERKLVQKISESRLRTDTAINIIINAVHDHVCEEFVRGK